MTTMPPKTFVDLYLRLSDGKDLSSLPARERALHRAAAERGWTVNRVVTENDLAKGKRRNASAFKRRKMTLPDGRIELRTDRPGFRSILDDLYTGRAHALLCEDLDRVVRDPKDGEDLLSVVELRKASADSLSESLKLTNGGTDAEVYAFRGSVNAANKASKDTARRVRAARGRQADEGIWGGGRRPYGFTPLPAPDGKYQNTRLVVNLDERDEIRKAADQVRAGVPLKSIARDLNERGVATVTGVPWTAEALRTILLRALNTGVVVYDGRETEVRLPGEPILEEDVWRTVVRKLTDPDDVISYTDSRGNTRKVARGAGVGRAPTWLGTNMYRCPCGAPMEIQRGTGRAAAYRCSRKGGTGDVHTRRNAEALDRYVADLVVERLSRPDAVSLFAAPTSTVDVPALRAEAQRISDKLDQVQADYDNDIMDRARYLASMKRHRAALDGINAQLAGAVNVDPVARLANEDDVRTAWTGMSLAMRRKVVDQMMTVTVLPAGRGRGFDPQCVAVQRKEPVKQF